MHILSLMNRNLSIPMFSFFLEKPTVDEYFHGGPVVYGCGDHRLRFASSDPQEQRSAQAKALFEDRQLQLKNFEKTSIPMMVWFLTLPSCF